MFDVRFLHLRRDTSEIILLHVFLPHIVTVVYASWSNTDFVHRSDPSQKRFLPCFDRCGTCKQRLYVLVDCSFLANCTLLLIRSWAEMYLQMALWKQAEKDSGVDDEMDADFAHTIWGNLARWKRWKHCSFLRQGSNCRSEVITDSEWTPEGVNDFCRSRSRTRSRNFEWNPDPEQEWEFQFLQESDN